MKSRSYSGGVCLLFGFLLVSAGSVNLLSAAPSGREQEKTGPTILLGRQIYTEAELETYVRLAYGKLDGYLRADGAMAEFKLSGFRTILAGDFDRVPYSEIVSFPGAAKLDITRIEMTDQGLQKTSVAYRPRLRQPDPLATETWGNVVRGQSFGAVMKLATDEPQLADARALTTFQVRRTIGGAMDVYRAAFLWLVDAEGQQLRAYVADPFSKGVDIALGERYVPARESSAPKPQTKTCERDLDCEDGGGSTAPQCKAASSQFSPQEQFYSGAENHNSGGHVMTFRPTFTCQCQSNCMSSCQPNPTISCTDSQDISGLNSYHNAVGNLAVEMGSSADGLNVATQCMTGGGCAVRECLTATFCSLTVSVSITRSGVGASVSLTTSEGVIWSRTAQANHSCPKCELYTPPPPPPPPGGGGDSVSQVSGGGPTLWAVDCGTNGSVDYVISAYTRAEAQETADLICG
jgi:hypothetical protein